jgi:hypothetical protein
MDILERAAFGTFLFVTVFGVRNWFLLAGRQGTEFRYGGVRIGLGCFSRLGALRFFLRRALGGLCGAGA